MTILATLAQAFTANTPFTGNHPKSRIFREYDDPWVNVSTIRRPRFTLWAHVRIKQESPLYGTLEHGNEFVLIKNRVLTSRSANITSDAIIRKYQMPWGVPDDDYFEDFEDLE